MNIREIKEEYIRIATYSKYSYLLEIVSIILVILIFIPCIVLFGETLNKIWG